MAKVGGYPERHGEAKEGQFDAVSDVWNLKSLSSSFSPTFSPKLCSVWDLDGKRWELMGESRDLLAALLWLACTPDTLAWEALSLYNLIRYFLK